jgi:hypothetical protein
MIKESVFTDEYQLTDTTDTQSLKKEQLSNLDTKNSNEIINKIEIDYELSKPRRKIIRARIIEK